MIQFPDHRCRWLSCQCGWFAAAQLPHVRWHLPEIAGRRSARSDRRFPKRTACVGAEDAGRTVVTVLFAPCLRRGVSLVRAGRAQNSWTQLRQLSEDGSATTADRTQRI